MDSDTKPPEGDDIPHGTKLFRVSHDDLADLERFIPDLISMLGLAHNQPHVRTKIRRIKQILSDVRWEGMPWESVQIVPTDEG